MKEIYDWAERLRKEQSLDHAIDAVQTRMRDSSSEERRHLASSLVSFLTLAQRDSEAVEVIDEMIERDTDDVSFPIRKASHFLYFMDDPDRALNFIDLALQRAFRTGLFRREALGVKARILLKLGRGDDLTRVLEQIMAMNMIKGVPDVGRERDFVDRAPPGMIPADVLARYNLFRPKRSEDSEADEPPEWEPPEWE
jgi:hypothetical protein